MTREELLQKLRDLAPEIKAEGVASMSLFGSRARGDAKPDSDIDLLIDVAPEVRFSLLNVSGIGLLVQDATGLPAQVSLRRSLDARTKERIQDDLIRVF